MQCHAKPCKPGHHFQRERECVCVCECVKERKRDFCFLCFLSAFCLFFLLWKERFFLSYLLIVCSFCCEYSNASSHASQPAHMQSATLAMQAMPASHASHASHAIFSSSTLQRVCVCMCERKSVCVCVCWSVCKRERETFVFLCFLSAFCLFCI